MKFNVSTFNHYFVEGVNLLWKLGLGAGGVAAVCFTIFLIQEIRKDKLRGGDKVSAYVLSFEKGGYFSLYNQREKKFTLEDLDWISHLDNSEDSIAVYSKNLRRGFYDYRTGKPLTENVYNKAWNFHEGLGAFGFDGSQLNVLLVKRGGELYAGWWAFPGGFVKLDESAETGALRELREETQLTPKYVEQFHTYSDPGRDPRERVITIAYLALVRIQDVKGGDYAKEAQWFPIDKIPQLAFDHDAILRDAMARLRERIHFHPIGYELLPEKFTLKELQMLYEAVLGIHFDRRNFAKKMFHLDILTQLDETVWPTPKREANLYKFNLDKYNELKQRGFRLEF